MGIAAQYVIEDLAKLPVRVELASEFRYREPVLEKNTLVVIVSQSGETADSLAALRAAKDRGAKTLAIVNVVGSSIAREADNVLYTLAGPEIAVATTKAYSTQLAATYALAIALGYARGTLEEGERGRLIKELSALPEKMQRTLEDKERIQWFAAKFANAKDIFFIGRGVDYFNVEQFGADFAYTMDGGFEGELEYENFNAAGAKIHIQGRNVPPGMAKNKMLNAIDIACELNQLLPATQRPQYTEGYEGFFHCVGFKGTVEEADLQYIIRDHDMQLFEQKKTFMVACVEHLNHKYSAGIVSLQIKDQYFNMRKMVEPHPEVIEKAKEAMRLAEVEPIVKPIRGGTDGARLSFMGLPCPNLFTGGMNFHGKFEYCLLNTMQKATQVILNLAQLWAK